MGVCRFVRTNIGDARNRTGGRGRQNSVHVLRSLLVALLAALALSAGATTVAPPPASACSCARGTVDDQARWADVVFSGELVGRRTDGHDVRYTFDVTEVYDGVATPSTDVVTAGGGQCGTVGLREGRDYVVFAHGGEEGLTTGLCSGTRKAASSYVDRVEAALGAGEPPVADRSEGAGGPPATSDGWEGSGPLVAVAGVAGLLILGALGVGAWRAAHGQSVSSRA